MLIYFKISACIKNVLKLDIFRKEKQKNNKKKKQWNKKKKQFESHRDILVTKLVMEFLLCFIIAKKKFFIIIAKL